MLEHNQWRAVNLRRTAFPCYTNQHIMHGHHAWINTPCMDMHCTHPNKKRTTRTTQFRLPDRMIRCNLHVNNERWKQTRWRWRARDSAVRAVAACFSASLLIASASSRNAAVSCSSNRDLSSTRFLHTILNMSCPSPKTMSGVPEPQELAGMFVLFRAIHAMAVDASTMPLPFLQP